jgi:hypothetical protein
MTMPNDQEWKKAFADKNWGRMFECGDFEEMVEDISTIINQEKEKVLLEKCSVYDCGFSDGKAAERLRIKDAIDSKLKPE